MLRVPLPQVAIGELCQLHASPADDTPVGQGVVVALEHGIASVGLLQDSAGLSVQCLVTPTGQPPSVAASWARLGSVIDGTGREVERLAAAQAGPVQVRSLATMSW